MKWCHLWKEFLQDTERLAEKYWFKLKVLCQLLLWVKIRVETTEAYNSSPINSEFRHVSTVWSLHIWDNFPTFIKLVKWDLHGELWMSNWAFTSVLKIYLAAQLSPHEFHKHQFYMSISTSTCPNLPLWSSPHTSAHSFLLPLPSVNGSLCIQFCQLETEGPFWHHFLHLLPTHRDQLITNFCPFFSSNTSQTPSLFHSSLARNLKSQESFFF